LGAAAQRHLSDPPDQHVGGPFGKQPALPEHPVSGVRMRQEEGKVNRTQSEPNIKIPDGFYDELLGAHKRAEQGTKVSVNARLILFWPTHLGDQAILRRRVELRNQHRPKHRTRNIAQGARV